MTAPQDSYHHGNLRAALLASALDVLAERGVAGFSMREAARRAGVSQSAPKHHFGDTRGLLGALATRAFRELSERLETAAPASDTARQRVSALGREYLAFARAHRALFDLMWRTTQFDVNEPDLMEQKLRARRALDRSLRGPEAELGEGRVTDEAASFAIWSLVHGYTTLSLEDGGDTMPAGDLLPTMLQLLDVYDSA